MDELWTKRGTAADLPELQRIANEQTEKRYAGEYPKNPDEWWVLFNKWYDPELHAIVDRFAADKVADFEKAAESKNHEKLIECMEDAWFRAPDAMGIHSIPGWGVMCDLSSEAYVFNEDQDDKDE